MIFVSDVLDKKQYREDIETEVAVLIKEALRTEPLRPRLRIRVKTMGQIPIIIAEGELGFLTTGHWYPIQAYCDERTSQMSRTFTVILWKQTKRIQEAIAQTLSHWPANGSMFFS
ncbi:hypothetical protein BRL53_04825 [Corynebacterium ulcerans]|nr:hypothetical protein BRL53_04825 [Corynebacterium ulcerans]